MIEKYNHGQRERLAFIDFCLQFYGRVSRNDLIKHFQTGPASCSRDLTLYRELAPDNLILKHHDKLYHRTITFKPLFNHLTDIVFTHLINGFGDGLSKQPEQNEICFDAVRLIHPNSETVATIVRSIKAGQVLKCEYHSLSSGFTEREIVPHAIINNGHRWHIRGFDRKTSSFRDFVCTRFELLERSDKEALEHELQNKDIEWNTVLDFELVAHPSLPHKEGVEMDYAMNKGVLRLEVRSAIAWYLVKQWNIDCTEDASNIAQLWLRNSKKFKEQL